MDWSVLVENKLSPVTYTVRMPDKRKKIPPYTNMMKLWHPLAAAVFSTSQKPAGEDDLGLDKYSFTTILEADTGMMLGPDLTTDQHPRYLLTYQALHKQHSCILSQVLHIRLTLTHKLSPRPGKEKSIRRYRLC